MNFYILFNIIKYNKIIKSNCLNSKINNQNIWIQNCLISIISSVGDGGAIYISGNYDLFINDTTFYQCISISGQGGAIFFYNGLDFQLFRICGFNCHAGINKPFQFSWSYTFKNHILDLNSISKCSNESTGTQTLQLEYGKQKINNINMTFNYVIYVSGIVYFIPTSMNNDYSTFYNNTSSSHVCIHPYGKSGQILKSNIINNISPIYGVIGGWNSGIYTFLDCNFFGNLNILIYINSGSISLINCSINHDIYKITTLSGLNPYIFPLNTTISKFHSHDSYKTFFCSPILNSEIFEPTLSNTFEKTVIITISPTITPKSNQILISFYSNTIIPSISNIQISSIQLITFKTFITSLYFESTSNFSVYFSTITHSITYYEISTNYYIYIPTIIFINSQIQYFIYSFLESVTEEVFIEGSTLISFSLLIISFLLIFFYRENIQEETKSEESTNSSKIEEIERIIEFPIDSKFDFDDNWLKNDY